MTRFLSLFGFLAFLTLTFAPLTSQAGDKSVSDKEAIAFVKNTAERGLTFLSDPSSSENKKKDEFRKLLNANFDMDAIARFSMGRYWNAANAAQKSEYMNLFRKMIVNVYAQRFGDYKGEKFEVKAARPVGKGDALVSSYIMPVNGGENIQVDWRIRDTGGALKIVDVYVAGVSMSVTQRADFSSVIQRGGGDVGVLIDYLKQKS